MVNAGDGTHEHPTQALLDAHAMLTHFTRTRLGTLEGKLVKHLGGENYLFRDDSGEVEVEVDGDVWRGTEVGPDDLIRVRGEVDHSWNKTEVEVEHLEKVGAAPLSKGGFIAK